MSSWCLIHARVFALAFLSISCAGAFNAGAAQVEPTPEFEPHAGADAAASKLSTAGIFDPTDWTVGMKKVLAIRFRFPDQPNVDPISLAELDVGYQQALQQLPGFSSGLFALDPQLVVTPTVTLPNPSAFYTGKNWYEELLSDARAAAAGSGPSYNALYDTRNYHLDLLISKTLDGSTPTPIAAISGKGIWAAAAVHINAIAHELGHNLGLPHASFAAHGYATFGPLKISEIVEYGDHHNVMGPGPTLGAQERFHFNPLEKMLLGWVPPSAFQSVTSSGTYRIFAHDQPGLSAGQKIGLRVPHSPQEETWYSFRQLFIDNPWSMNGAELHGWNPYIHTFTTGTVANVIRLDPNPATPQNDDDATLVIGRTLKDPYANVFVTAIGKGGTSPESLDLVVNFGPFAANVAPTLALGASSVSVATGTPVTFTATAMDANADALAYFFDFGDLSFSTNNGAVANKTWGVAGKYRVHCIVSDMKGGEARQSLTITVGAPTVGSVSGIVLDASGNPLAGVHVHNGLNATGNSNYRGTFSASDGSYTITNLAAGSYTITAGMEQSAFTRDGGWNNPVVVAAAQDIVQKNFRRVGGLISITGRVRAGPFAAFIQGISVHIVKSDGSSTDVISDATGTWQLSVPQGITTVTALAPAGSGWTTGEAYPGMGGAYPTPWLINVGGVAIDNLNFYFRTPDLPVVGFQSPTSNVSESAAEAVIPVSVTRAGGTRLVMTLKVSSGTTASGGTADSIGADHYLANQVFSFPAIDPSNPPSNMIQQTFDVHVPLINDLQFEGNETLMLQLIVGQVTYAASNLSHTLTIVDDELDPNLFGDGFEVGAIPGLGMQTR